MSFVHVAGAQPESFADGLEIAGRLAAAAEHHDPDALRAVASIVEARATSILDFGLACGCRLIAEDVEAERAAQASFVAILEELIAAGHVDKDTVAEVALDLTDDLAREHAAPVLVVGATYRESDVLAMLGLEDTEVTS